MFLPDRDETEEILRSRCATNSFNTVNQFSDRYRNSHGKFALAIHLLPASSFLHDDYIIFMAETQVEANALLLDYKLERTK
jgi:hypothetical protein